MRLAHTLWIAFGLVIAIASSSQSAFGGDALQTDWSGGDGIAGPVTDWQKQFAASEAMDWASAPGSLTLLPAMPIEHAVTTTFGEPAGVAAADVDGDLDVDIISVAYQGHEVAWWENDGTGGSWTQHTIATSFTGACSLEASDFDHDGDVDVAATAESAGDVAWFENDGTGLNWTQHVVDAAIGGPFSVCSADFDHDDDFDLCSAAFTAGKIVWWENTDGSGTSWVRRDVDASFSGAWWAVVEDVNVDGHMDVVGAAYSANDICWYENNGNGSAWTEHVVDPSFARPISVRTGDIDGDTDTDIVAASNRGRIAWWENDGTAGGWLTHTVDAQLAEPFGLRVADMDGDGDEDVITNERTGNRVMWYENTDGTGLVWLKHLVDVTCSGPTDVLAADVYGDEQAEIIATFSWDNSIIWYEPASTYADSAALESSILNSGSDATQWGNIDWDHVTPLGTSVSVEVRASSDSLNMGTWVGVASSGDDLSAYIADGTRYFQYRLTLATTEASVSPSMEQIHVAYAYSSAVDEEGAAGDGRFSCGVMGNPGLSDAARIRFEVPHTCRVVLGLYDAGGRAIRTILAGTYPAGEYATTLRGLARGLYLYRLDAGALRHTGKIVVR
jgi:hypothetical protein